MRRKARTPAGIRELEQRLSLQVFAEPEATRGVIGAIGEIASEVFCLGTEESAVPASTRGDIIIAGASAFVSGAVADGCFEEASCRRFKVDQRARESGERGAGTRRNSENGLCLTTIFCTHVGMC